MKAGEAAPSDLLAAVAPPDPAQPWRTPGRWNFSLYLAIRDRRALPGPGLAQGESVAGLRDTEVIVGGCYGPALKDRFLKIAADWLQLGSPTIGDYGLTFSPPLPRLVDPVDTRTGPWHLDRLHHQETVALTSP